MPVTSNYRFNDKIKVLGGFYQGYKGCLKDYNPENSLCLVELRLSLDNKSYVWIHEGEFMKISEDIYMEGFE
jgi:hypothetical protein